MLSRGLSGLWERPYPVCLLISGLSGTAFWPKFVTFIRIRRRLGSIRVGWCGYFCWKFERVRISFFLFEAELMLELSCGCFVGIPRNRAWRRPFSTWYSLSCLLRIPTRGETSDMTPRKYSIASIPSKTNHSFLLFIQVSLSPISSPALNLSTVIWRYIRQFMKMDAKEALQYVYCVTLSSEQGRGFGKEQVGELTRRIIVLAKSGHGWEELVGGLELKEADPWVIFIP
jgi:hypothetical protein